ncbi:MAG: hypothetical protein IKU48_00085 [Clostridia bacterium]|nr:hypothetical protein [Clostridia bacterium]
MKNFVKFLVIVFSVAITASLVSVSSLAAELIDPNTLQPGSNKVIFIKDAPKDANNQIIGKLEGDGTGFDAENPLQPIAPENFIHDDRCTEWYFQTAFYQATELLKDDGGTIVICGPVYLGVNDSNASDGSVIDIFTAKYGENTIKITSVYNGVDYREKAGAKIVLESPVGIGMEGRSIWENIDIATASASCVISFNNFATLVGEGVNCYPTDEAIKGIESNYVSLTAGHRYLGGVDLTTNLVVKSGTYNVIAAGEWGVNNRRELKDDGTVIRTNNLEGNTNANLVIEGTTTVYGEVIGTNKEGAEFSGNSTVTINGGKFKCEFSMVGKTGLMNTDGKVTLKINGGDFSDAWAINDATAGCANNMPAVSILDFSGWTGELSDLANAYGVVTEFSEIKLPAGVTGGQVLVAATTATELAETELEVTTPIETASAVTEAEDVETSASETEAPVVDGGANMTIVVIAIVAVVVIAGVVVGVILAKKKK